MKYLVMIDFYQSQMESNDHYLILLPNGVLSDDLYLIPKHNGLSSDDH